MVVAAQDNSAGEAGVFRRHVLYIPGYDPFPPRRYRELYRSEGAAQAAISGYRLEIQPRAGETYGWRVAARIEGREVEAEVEVLVWSDLVQQSMAQGIAETYLQLVRTARAYIGHGALFRLMRLRKGPMIAALYPIAVLILQAVIALLVLFLAAKAVAWAWLVLVGPGSPGHWVAILFGLLAGWLTLRGFRALDHRIYAYYLMHDYAFTAGLEGENPPALERRMAEFRSRIRAALERDLDEVLVVGHSSGVHLAVSILADLIREGLPARRPALGFLSLGQVVPMVSFLPRAGRLRGDLAYLSTRAELTWVDVSAPGDGCSFALCDPVAVTGVAPEGQRWPLVLSAAFSQTLRPETWQALRRRYFRLHFQYLCAFDRPGDYDYFRITAGPMTLAERFRGRKPSASRITRPLSPHRSVA
ncbi:hypothetical protein [Tabrizicola flagellatus]|uniref:hypothetical protein n=1 Tax=Tabrizicola flagellatus TaxID=2593021 RepID=UPI0011F3E94D|nr:hypothetical protein [Tabrizicola flagellatus]